MVLRKRLKKRKRLKLKPIVNYLANKKGNPITGYGARVDPVCTVCKRHKPLNWWVKGCADITCKGRYKVTKRRLLKHESN